jgi:hypothetical protein
MDTTVVFWPYYNPNILNLAHQAPSSGWDFIYLKILMQ